MRAQSRRGKRWTHDVLERSGVACSPMALVTRAEVHLAAARRQSRQPLNLPGTLRASSHRPWILGNVLCMPQAAVEAVYQFMGPRRAALLASREAQLLICCRTLGVCMTRREAVCIAPASCQRNYANSGPVRPPGTWGRDERIAKHHGRRQDLVGAAPPGRLVAGAAPEPSSGQLHQRLRNRPRACGCKLGPLRRLTHPGCA